MRLGVLIIVLMLLGCAEIEQPIPSQDGKAKALSQHSVRVVSYRIPEGDFRGVFWPFFNKSAFEIRNYVERKEYFYEIKAPPEFIHKFPKSPTRVDDDWKVELTETNQSSLKYTARSNDGKKAIQLELPKKTRNYSFAVLRDSSNIELILFMDLGEQVVDIGLFGYVVVNKKT